MFFQFINVGEKQMHQEDQGSPVAGATQNWTNSPFLNPTVMAALKRQEEILQPAIQKWLERIQHRFSRHN